MLHWRAVFHSTGEVLMAGPDCEPQSYDLASSFVDLRWQFQGRGDTVTLECVDSSGAITSRWAPLPAVLPMTPERIAEVCARFV